MDKGRLKSTYVYLISWFFNVELDGTQRKNQTVNISHFSDIRQLWTAGYLLIPMVALAL
jgi:hypothetical protein